MTATSGALDKQLPPIPIISQRMIKYSWKSVEMEEYQEEATRKWLEEVYLAETQTDKDAQEPETLPTSILAGLYPEVVAFGVNGQKVAQVFQFFLQLNNYLGEREGNFQAQEAFAHFIEEIPKSLWDTNPDSARNFFTKEHKSIRYKQIMICGHNSMLQRTSFGIDLSTLEQIYTPSWLYPIIEHTLFIFVAQSPEIKDDSRVVNFTSHFNGQWEELRKNLAKAGFQADMPRLIENEARR